MAMKMRLGDALIHNNVISEDQLKMALELQKNTHEKLGTILVTAGLITEKQLFSVLESQFGVKYVDLNNTFIDPKVPKLINESIARKHTCLPISLERGSLIVAMEDPLDIIAKDDIRIITGLKVNVVMCNHKDILRAIDHYYDISEIAEKAVEEFSLQGTYTEVAEIEENEDVTNSPMVRLVNTIITQAVKSRASDIHIEPFEKYVRIRYRVDGELREVMSPTKNTHSALITRIKIMGKMDISEKRIPQDGRVETTVGGMPIDMRISVIPTVYGEKAVIRLLDRNSLVIRKEDMMTPDNLYKLEQLLKVPEGILLVTGPTGSGKTTTLYTLLREINKESQNIITIEDPVEYRLEGVNQMQVNNKAGLTFANGLRAILRQDPDVIMVGEIRDPETAQIATRAAITGHRVLSTLHTNDTTSTINRLINMGIENYLVSTSIVGIIAQRLMKKVCPMCKVEHSATEEDKAILGIFNNSEVLVYRGKGCNACNQTGYLGRIAIHEILGFDTEIRELINQNVSSDVLKANAIKNGMKTLRDTAAQLVLEGVTTTDELLRITFSLDK